LKIETKDLEDRRVQVTVEVPPENLDSAMHSAARRLSKNTRIAGFRPGKAPNNMIVNKLGEEIIFDEALENLGQDLYRQALEESELEPFAPGSLDEIVSRDPLVLRYTVPLPPEVDLGNYREIRIPYVEPETTDETVEETMEELRQSRALIEPADRPAAMSDVVVLDIKGTLRDAGQADEAVLMDHTGIELLLDDKTDWPFSGIADKLVDLKAGEELDLEHTFPSDFAAEDLREKTADFHIVCQDVKSRIVPEWTDDLATSMGDFEDLLDLRVKVRQSLQDNAQRENDSAFATKAVEAAVEGAKISFPPILLDEEIDGMLSEMTRQLASQNLSLEDYLKVEGKTLEELRTEFEPQAIKRLNRALVLGRIVELEQIKIEGDEIGTAIDRMVEPFEDRADELRKAFDHPQGRQKIAMDLLTEKAIHHIVSIAKGEADITEESSEAPIEGEAPQEDEKSKE
jgi:trigger factor